MIVYGTIGEGRSYLSDDQRDVYTDYPINEPVFAYRSELASIPAGRVVQGVTVTQLGGTVTVNGVAFTQTEPALPPLEAGTRGLFPAAA